MIGMIEPRASSGGRERRPLGGNWPTSLSLTDTAKHTDMGLNNTSKPAAQKSWADAPRCLGSEKMAKNFPSSFRFHRFKTARAYYSSVTYVISQTAMR